MNIEDIEIGTQIGYLTILEHHMIKGNGKVSLCQCVCGNKKLISYSAIKRNKVKSCGCRRVQKGRILTDAWKENISKAKIVDISQNKFGNLLVIEQSLEVDKSGTKKWKCICDCGNYHIVTKSSLVRGKSTHCGCKFISHRRNPDRELQLWKHLFNSNIKKKNKKRGFVADFNLQKFIEMSKDACYYCGIYESSYLNDRGHGSNISETCIRYNGLDRLNSNLGYTLDNIVTSCKWCNQAKNIMTKEEFLKFIERIYNHSIKKN